MINDIISWLKRWPNGFIVAFVVIQLLLPLTYYFARLDTHDERWAWRMFSPTRMVKCEVSFSVDGQPVPLQREFHQAWTEIAQRGRRVVVEEMGARLCKKNPGKAVVARLACKPIASRNKSAPVPAGKSRSEWLRGPEYYMGGFNLCEIPEL